MGWRDDSLRMVVVLTDAGFKTALDGKVTTTEDHRNVIIMLHSLYWGARGE